MRRIAVMNGLFNDPERCSISRRDYRLMLAVVKAAEECGRILDDIDFGPVADAIKALNTRVDKGGER